MNKTSIIITIIILVLLSIFSLSQTNTKVQNTPEDTYSAYIASIHEKNAQETHNLLSKSLQKVTPIEQINKIYESLEIIDITNTEIIGECEMPTIISIIKKRIDKSTCFNIQTKEHYKFKTRRGGIIESTGSRTSTTYMIIENDKWKFTENIPEPLEFFNNNV